MNILLADNDLISREMLRETFSRAQFHVFAAATIDEALSLADHIPFAFAFCAVCLPPLGGFYAAEALLIKQPRLITNIHIPLPLLEPDKLFIYTTIDDHLMPLGHPLADLPTSLTSLSLSTTPRPAPQHLPLGIGA